MSIPLTFEAISSESYISIERYNSPKEKFFTYNKNEEGWKKYRVGEKVYLEEGDKVSFQSTTEHFSTNKDNYYRFLTQGSGTIKVYGNPNSLINGTDKLFDYVFYKLFHNCRNLVDASELELSFNNISKGGYQCMFENCFSLQKAPALPAKHLEQSSYLGMFRQCILLTQAPSELPAYNLKEKCYAHMFEKCLKLTTSPIIKAQLPTQGSCGFMFYHCQNLNKITVNFTDWNLEYLPTDCWVNCVAKNGIFVMPGQLSIVRGKHNIPKLWSIQIQN